MQVAARADALREVPARIRFISYEPALGPLDDLDLSGIHWVIYGGESGPGHRPEGEPGDPKAWARAMSNKCRIAGLAFFHKQSAASRTEMGIELDGRIIREFPLALIRSLHRAAA
jgi:protein gp37